MPLTVAAAQGVLANDNAPGRWAGGDGRHHRHRPRWDGGAGGRRLVHLHSGPDFSGADSFTYTAQDIDGDTDEGTVGLSVAAMPGTIPAVNLDDVATGPGSRSSARTPPGLAPTA